MCASSARRESRSRRMRSRCFSSSARSAAAARSRRVDGLGDRGDTSWRGLYRVGIDDGQSALCRSCSYVAQRCEYLPRICGEACG